MGDEARLWQVAAGDQLQAVQRASLASSEQRLEEWLLADISILDPALLSVEARVASHSVV